MTVNGEDKEAVWESPTIFEKNKVYYFIMGITNASRLSKSLRSLYIDSEGGNNF